MIGATNTINVDYFDSIRSSKSMFAGRVTENIFLARLRSCRKRLRSQGRGMLECLLRTQLIILSPMTMLDSGEPDLPDLFTPEDPKPDKLDVEDSVISCLALFLRDR